MKFIKNLFLVAALALVSFSAHAQSLTFGLTSTDIGATNSHVIIPASSADRVAQIDYVSVTSDKATSKLTLFTAGDPVQITAAAVAGTTATAVGTGNFVANDIVVMRHTSTTPETYERLVVSSVSATTVVFTASTVSAMGAYDFLYKVTAGPYVPVAAATVSITTPFFYGQAGKPVYAEIDSTSASQINLIAGRFVQIK